MQFEGARGWQIYDSVMEQNNFQLVATNFQTLNIKTPSKAELFIDSTRNIAVEASCHSAQAVACFGFVGMSVGVIASFPLAFDGGWATRYSADQ